MANVSKQNRAEKKARKAVGKLGFKKLDGISRVTIKKGRNMLFVVAEPEVFKAPSSETYVVFGEADVQDMNKQAKAVSFNMSAVAAVVGEGGRSRGVGWRGRRKHALLQQGRHSFSHVTPLLPQMAAKQFARAPPVAESAATTQAQEEEEEDGEVDEEGLTDKDIELVMTQADVSRAKAVKALKENNKDIVAAILALTS